MSFGCVRFGVESSVRGKCREQCTRSSARGGDGWASHSGHKQICSAGRGPEPQHHTDH